MVFAAGEPRQELPSLPRVDGFDRFAAASLGARLRELGLDRSYVRAHSTGSDTLWSPLTPTRAALYDDDPLPVAFRLWFCGLPIEPSMVASSLGVALARDCEESGLLGRNADGDLASPFHFRTAGGVYLFSDYIGHSEAVMGAGQTTAVLFQAARPAMAIGSAFDLGCGAGTLALLLAPWCRRVVASDLNDRAIPFVELNARLNGIGNIEARAGSLFDPVAGEQFDLIVSQPPYYPDAAPGDCQTLLHGGPRGDELALRVIEGLPDHLTPNGRGIVFAARTGTAANLAVERLRVLELTAGFREPSGAEQTMTVVEHAAPARPAGFRRATVLGQEWGSIGESRISDIMA